MCEFLTPFFVLFLTYVYFGGVALLVLSATAYSLLNGTVQVHPPHPHLFSFFFLLHLLNVFLGYVILCVVALLIGKCIQAACILHRASPPTPLIFLLRLVNVFSVYMFFCKCCLHLPHTLCKVLFPLFCF